MTLVELASGGRFAIGVPTWLDMATVVAGDEVSQETSGTLTSHLCVCHNEIVINNCVDLTQLELKVWKWSHTVSGVRCLFSVLQKFKA